MRLSALGLLAVLQLAACAPWRSSQGSPEALRGKRTFTVLPIDWASAEVDGKPLKVFLAEDGPEWRANWDSLVADASTQLTNVVRDKLRAGGLEYAEQGGDVTVRPRARRLQIDPYRPIVLQLEVDAVDGSGAMLEQVQLRATFDLLLIEFDQKLRFVAREAGEIVAKWLVQAAAG
jgi:hypothetical protein